MAFTNQFFRYLILYARTTSFKLSSSFVLVLFFRNYIKLAMSTRKVYTGDSKYISYPSINTCQVSSVRKADPCLISRKLKGQISFQTSLPCANAKLIISMSAVEFLKWEKYIHESISWLQYFHTWNISPEKHVTVFAVIVAVHQLGLADVVLEDFANF